MEIQSIALHRVYVPYDTARRRALAEHDPYNMATAPEDGMESLMVAVTTADGHTGWGEAFGHRSNPATWATLTDIVGPYFLGRACADPAQAHEAACQAFHAFGQTGPVLYALAGIDIALWDIAAQRAGLPLYRLLGGQRSTVTTYPSLPRYGEPDEVRAQVERVRALGYRQIKLHEIALDAMDAALDALPGDTMLCVDVNCPWSWADALATARHLKSRGMGWLEEPLWPPDDLRALARLRADSAMPLAAGENASGLQGLLLHWDLHAVDILQPSVAKVGVTAMRRLFEMAGPSRARVVPHCFYLGPGLLATAHLAACLPDDTPLELPFLHFHEHPHAWLDYQPTMTLPDRPGLGFQPDTDVLSRCTLAHTTLTR